MEIKEKISNLKVIDNKETYKGRGFMPVLDGE